MSRLTILIIGFTLILVACSSQSTPTKVPLPSPQSTTVEVMEPTSTPQENDDISVQNLGSELESFQIIPNESEVSYEVGEIFPNQNNHFNVATRITPQVSGETFVDRNNPQNSSIGTISVDISQFKSDSGMRDNAIRERFLESAKFPIVTFIPTEILGLPESYQEG